MEDITYIKDSTNTQDEDRPPIEFSFEEELRRQNINTMLEIYGEEYLKKISLLTQQ